MLPKLEKLALESVRCPRFFSEMFGRLPLHLFLMERQTENATTAQSATSRVGGKDERREARVFSSHNREIASLNAGSFVRHFP